MNSRRSGEGLGAQFLIPKDIAGMECGLTAMEYLVNLELGRLDYLYPPAPEERVDDTEFPI